ncbi:hypothetical protein CM14_gp57 [Mycobacterium phage Acadian]|uniref:DUF6378 domain-containing protein n=1 Tax=Mycobacterium phage Acadian TaxID=2902794 RepID=G8I893_9CAUD|nr:hypothetical protein CM14_gp57 [Mycobacterium phage Acadian]AER48970.1 hypothetical protein ACADIAN_57 [Mycobacterium phage Acadian]
MPVLPPGTPSECTCNPNPVADYNRKCPVHRWYHTPDEETPMPDSEHAMGHAIADAEQRRVEREFCSCTDGEPCPVHDRDRVPFPTDRTCGKCGQPIMSTELNAEVEPGRRIHITCPTYHYVLDQAKPEATGVYAAQVAQEAIDLFTGPRNADYGDATDNFTDIADLWTVVLRPILQLDARITAEQVAIMSALIKVARLNNTPDHDDSWTDATAYLALGAGINRRRQA